MAIFTQPQNREKELKTILDGYRKFIDHPYWLSDIFQKDGIQNSWGARRTKKGKDWICKVFYTEKMNLAGLVDHGSAGLTGIIPKNKHDIRNALYEENPSRNEERLAAFLSQDWSSKGWNDLGS